MSSILRHPLLLSLLTVFALSGCATKYAFQKENFSEKGPFDHRFNASKDVVYQAMKRIALRQGFAIEKESEETTALVVSKQYQDGNINTLLTLSGIAMGNGRVSDAWIAAQEVSMKSTEAKQMTSIGLGFGLSIPIPTGTVSSLTKERGETIKDKDFYARMFAAIEKELPEVSAQMADQKHDEEQRLRAEIEKKLRIEMEIRAKLEAEARNPSRAPETPSVPLSTQMQATPVSAATSAK
ncbi:DUF2242 domain-containing protein [Crenobacter intestini]|uniref:DUF2242 domain-containing protein n=1 Tax=Crenobacter intestini TaxID=2563443 RepID=A0A4V4N8Y6_9NEIS|nr:DUF2242 domain-containing protein [Crenobacter intestini]TIC86163.1 DUF2242 domain-containing protein [Crenobacter intestini]